MTLQGKKLYAFGPFRLDPARRLLLRENRPIPLQLKAFEILLVLVRSGGEVVMKDDLMKAVWPDTFVEESNLAQNIFVLRKILGASGGDRSYIVTHPGRGYSFVEKVMVVPVAAGDVAVQEEESLVVETHTRSRLVIEEQLGPVSAHSAKGQRLRWVLISVASVATILALVAYFLIARKPKIAEKDIVVLAEFANKTNDPVFDDTLKTALGIALEQSPFLHTLSDHQVGTTLRLMTRPDSTKLTPELAREVCQRAGGAAYITGSITALGSQYVVALEAVNCRSGDSMVTQQVAASSKETVLAALDKAALSLRRELGESLAGAQEFDTPLAVATTSSLEALKAYSLAEKLLFKRDPAAAIPYSQRAIDLDPKFATAYVQMGVAYFSLNQVGRASEYFAKAFQLRERANESERLKITALYYGYATGELEKAVQVLEEEVLIYPRSDRAYNALAVLYSRLGDYEKSERAAGTLHERDRDDSFAYVNMALDRMALQRFTEASQIIEEARSRKLDGYLLHNDLYALAFLRADTSAMQEQQSWYTNRPTYENYGLALAADTEAFFGRVKKARDLTQQSVASAVRADNREGAAIYEANKALQEAAYGDTSEAKRAATDALGLAHETSGVEAEAALAFAMVGDTGRAESLVKDLSERFPLDTQMQSFWLPTIHAELELSRQNWTLALRDLHSSNIELGNIPFGNNISCLYLTYASGQAYLAGGDSTAAAAEFQKIIDHRGIVWNCWTGSLAHLGLARANALQARSSQGAGADAARDKARASYKDFLVLWKDADPDIPILKQAKAEYAKLL
jgi:DNA-binding winged helix-turn-helix (wHTH) protein/tetratricopeptide (TPR) repeat protein